MLSVSSSIHDEIWTRNTMGKHKKLEKHLTRFQRILSGIGKMGPNGHYLGNFLAILETTFEGKMAQNNKSKKCFLVSISSPY